MPGFGQNGRMAFPRLRKFPHQLAMSPSFSATTGSKVVGVYLVAANIDAGAANIITIYNGVPQPTLLYQRVKQEGIKFGFSESEAGQLGSVADLGTGMTTGYHMAMVLPVGAAGMLSRGMVIFGELDDLGRPTGVRATIVPEMIGTGSDAPRIRPPGFGGQQAGHARGHLLGSQLGGSGTEPRNLVTLFQNPANHPAMSGFEAQIRAAVEAGQTVDYWSVPVYEGSNPLPVGVSLEGRGSGGFSLEVSVINRGQ